MQAEPEIHSDGCGFTEGPVALSDGGVAFVDLVDAKVRVWREGETSELASLPGAPNGMRMGPDGALWIANNGGLGLKAKGALHFAEPQIQGCIQRLTLDGAWETAASALPSAPPNRPNDLVFTPEGDIVFTNPRNWEAIGRHDADYAGGEILLAKLDGTVTKLAECRFPNGLWFHPDGSLIVGLTVNHRLVRYRWNEGGALEEPEVFAQLHDLFHCDGMCWHDGRFYVAGSVCNEVAVLDEGGNLLELIDFGRGSGPTNLCVQEDRLFVTLGKAGTLVSISLPSV